MFGKFKKKKPSPEKYIPPVMPPFPKTEDEVMKALAPHYQAGQPLIFFMEMYVVDVLGHLPDATHEALNDFSESFPKFFEAQNGSWQDFVRESLRSETIDIAIWDLWIKNSANAERDGWSYHPWHYAQNFTDNYLAENSRVDVWDGSSLEEAKARIMAYQARQT